MGDINEMNVAENSSELEEGEVADDDEESENAGDVSVISIDSTIPEAVDEAALVAALDPSGGGRLLNSALSGGPQQQQQSITGAVKPTSTSPLSKSGDKSLAELAQTAPKQRNRKGIGSAAAVDKPPPGPPPLVRSSTAARVTRSWAQEMVDLDTDKVSDLSGFSLRARAAVKDMLYRGVDLSMVSSVYALSADEIREHAAAVAPHVSARIVGPQDDRVRWARGLVRFGAADAAEASDRLDVMVDSVTAEDVDRDGDVADVAERRPGRSEDVNWGEAGQRSLRDAMEAAATAVIHSGQSVPRAARLFQVNERYLEEAVRRERYAHATRQVLSKKMTCKKAASVYGFAFTDLAAGVERARKEGVGGQRRDGAGQWNMSPPIRGRPENSDDEDYESLLQEFREKNRETSSQGGK